VDVSGVRILFLRRNMDMLCWRICYALLFWISGIFALLL
jgi:hypothetical protein